MRRSKHFWKAATVGTLALMLTFPTLSAADSVSLRSKASKGSPNLECRSEKGKWLSGDFHQHTYYTDGSTTFDFVMEKNNEYGLDWWANSEHGGSRNRDGEWPSLDGHRYYPTNPILGDVTAAAPGHVALAEPAGLRLPGYSGHPRALSGQEDLFRPGVERPRP